MGAPLPAAPPCILQRRFPRTAGDRHALPIRVRAPQRAFRCIGNFSGCISFFLGFFAIYLVRVYDPDDSLTASIDVDMLDGDLLLPLAAVAIERLEQEGIGAGEPIRLAQVLTAPLERLFAEH